MRASVAVQIRGVDGQQVGGGLPVQPGQPQFGQAGRGEIRGVDVSRREDDRHTLGLETASGEQQRLRRGPIQPVRVVDQAQQGLFFGQVSEHGEHCQADHEAIVTGR